MKKASKIFIYADGGSRGNPGPAGIGVVIKDGFGKKIKESYKYIGEVTNNIAEYNAVVSALEEALFLEAKDVVINLDSELVVRQLNGEYKVKNQDIKLLFGKILEMLKKFESYEIKHIRRSDNKEADKLANKAMNLAYLF